MNDGKRPTTETFAALAHSRRRAVLAILTSHQQAFSVRDLATHVVAYERSKPLLEVTEEEHHTARTSLHHSQLPTLEDFGVIDRNDGMVTATVQFDPAILQPRTGDVPDRSHSAAVDSLFTALAHDRRRSILGVLKTHHDDASNRGPLAVEDLAEAVGNRETEHSKSNPSDEELTQITLSLQHQHLPKLADTGLVTYDRAQQTVDYNGHPSLKDEWVEADRRAIRS